MARWLVKSWPLWMVLVLVSALYAQVFNAGYAWDDWQLFVNRSVLRNVNDWSDLFSAISKPILPGTTYFRPIVLLSFVVEFKIFGLFAKVSHAINFAIFLLNGLLVFFLVNRFARRNPVIKDEGRGVLVGALAALFYFIHPSQIESVAWISGRFDLLVTMFCLLTFCSDLFLDGWRRYALTTVFFVGAALSKEMALMMPVLMVLLHVVYSGAGRLTIFEWVGKLFKRYAWLFFWLISAGLFCLYLRYVSFGKLMQSGGVVEGVGGLPRIGFVGQTIIFYTRMLFWPFADQGPQHPFHLEKMSLVAEWCGILVVAFVALYLVFALWRRAQAQLLVLALMASFVPVLNIFPLKIGVNIGHERFMALPLVLASILVGQLILWVLSAKQSLRAFMSAILGGWLLVAVLNVYVTVPLWRNDVTLWSWAYAKAPLEPYTQLSLVGALYRDRDINGAERIINEAVAGGTDPGHFDVIRAAIMVEKGEFESGVKLLNSVLDRKGRPDEALTNAGVDMAAVQVNVDKSPEAASYAFSYVTLARAYIGLYDFRSAERAARLANFYNSDYPIGKLMLALSLYGQNNWDLGEREFNAARRAFHPDAQRDLEATRSYFFGKLCSSPKSPDVVCAAYKNAL